MNPIVEEKIAESIILDDTDAAHAGALWLDGEIPGWWKYIDLDTLDIADASYCIVGQLERSGINVPSGFDADKGFDCSMEREDSNFGDLYRAWRYEIERRQLA